MGTSATPRDPQIITLNRLLTSQQRLLLSNGSDSEAFKSHYERARIRANFDYARSLLLTVSSTRQLPREEITQKRDLVKRLQSRLNDLDQLYASAEDEDEDSNSEDEEGVPTQSTSLTVQDPSGLRRRTTANAATVPPTATSTSISTSTSNRYSKPPPPTAKSAIQTRESDEAEKQVLSNSLLSLASALKSSARSFSTAVEADKSTVNATFDALDQSRGGMDTAGGKIDLLKRETEGAGWFRRMKIYAQVFGLWLGLVLLVFVGPKFRF